MAGISALLKELLSRLPELEWQLKKHCTLFSSKALPKGLFNQYCDAPVTSYVAEIKSDIAVLQKQTSMQAAHYLSLKINQKINVLVAVCKNFPVQTGPEKATQVLMDKLMTRQQWIKDLEDKMTALNLQKKALEQTMQIQNQKSGSESWLNVQKELGELEKQLTMVKEAWEKG